MELELQSVQRFGQRGFFSPANMTTGGKIPFALKPITIQETSKPNNAFRRFDSNFIGTSCRL